MRDTIRTMRHIVVEIALLYTHGLYHRILVAANKCEVHAVESVLSVGELLVHETRCGIRLLYSAVSRGLAHRVIAGLGHTVHRMPTARCEI
jgi:hypothetical protein